MLDRSIPYKNIIMRCDRVLSELSDALPDGFSYTLYQSGNEWSWAKMMVQNGDSDSEAEAVDYFKNRYKNESIQLEERCVFVQNRSGELVASCIAWRDRKTPEGSYCASLHWLMTDEAYRNMGIGKALIVHILRIFEEKGEMPVYLHTQPWSAQAVRLYRRCGFVFAKDTFGGYENQNEAALKILGYQTELEAV